MPVIRPVIHASEVALDPQHSTVTRRKAFPLHKIERTQKPEVPEDVFELATTRRTDRSIILPRDQPSVQSSPTESVRVRSVASQGEWSAVSAMRAQE